MQYQMINNTCTTMIYTGAMDDVYSYGFAKGFIAAYAIIIGMLMFRRIIGY
jgi:hypothetical protein